jgi:hypothetical protein
MENGESNLIGAHRPLKSEVSVKTGFLDANSMIFPSQASEGDLEHGIKAIFDFLSKILSLLVE